MSRQLLSHSGASTLLLLLLLLHCSPAGHAADEEERMKKREEGVWLEKGLDPSIIFNIEHIIKV